MSSERDDDIVTWVDDRGRVSLAALAERFGVSEMTIRRDLDALTAAGRLLRVRGGAERLPSPGQAPQGSTAGLAGAAPRTPLGAVITSRGETAPGAPPTTALPTDSPAAPVRADPTDPAARPGSPSSALPGTTCSAPAGAGAPDDAPARTSDPWDAAAAAATADLVAGATVLLTGGPGCLALARHLARRAAGSATAAGFAGSVGTGGSPGTGQTLPLVVVTTAIAPAALLLGAPGVQLVVLGGEAEPGSDDLVGPAALAALGDLHLDLVLLSPAGLDARGAWSVTSAGAQLVAAAARGAAVGGGRVVAVVGPQALGRPARVRAVALDALDGVVAVRAPGEDAAAAGARLDVLRDAAPRSPALVAG